MSELSEIRDVVYQIKSTMDTHIAETKEYRVSKDNSDASYKKSLYDPKDGLVYRIIDVENNIKNLQEIERDKIWWRRSVVMAIAGLGLERIFHYWKG